MIQNEKTRVWVNRIFAFLGGGLLIFIILQASVISTAKKRNEELTKELDESKYESSRLLSEAKAYFEKSDYGNARKTLATLFEKHPASTETPEGKVLYAEIDKKQVEMDAKWDAAVGKIREEWAKTMAAELKVKFEKEREQLEKDMTYNLDREWDKMKDKIREEWEKQK